MDNPEVLIYSYNKDEVGKLTLTPEGIEIQLKGTDSLSVPNKEIMSATSHRIGRVAQSIYAIKIFLNLPGAIRLKNLLKELQVKVGDDKTLPSSAICNTTGEYVEFFVNPVDVFGYDLKGKPKVRKVIDAINGSGHI